jgi:hypothetical protein
MGDHKINFFFYDINFNLAADLDTPRKRVIIMNDFYNMDNGDGYLV